MADIKIKLTLMDWQKNGLSVYSTKDGVELTLGVFHSGSTFDGVITVDIGDDAELINSIKAGFQPCFWLSEVCV